jgi:hypothetical protein
MPMTQHLYSFHGRHLAHRHIHTITETSVYHQVQGIDLSTPDAIVALFDLALLHPKQRYFIACYLWKREKLDPPPYHSPQIAVSLDCIATLSIFQTVSIFRRRIFYWIHQQPEYGIEFIYCIFHKNQVEVYSKSQPTKTLTVIQVGLREVQELLEGVGPHCIDSWILQISNHHLVVIKVIWNMILELFGKMLPEPIYSVLSEDKYIWSDKVYDCTCGWK